MDDEKALLEGAVAAIRDLDPDMTVAFDLMRGSIGYLQARAPPWRGVYTASTRRLELVSTPLFTPTPSLRTTTRCRAPDPLSHLPDPPQARSQQLQWQPTLLRQLGRCPEHPGRQELFEDSYGEVTQHNLHTSGRVSVNLWRALRFELKLPIYNFESCAAAILQMRVPEIAPHVLFGRKGRGLRAGVEGSGAE